MVKVGVLGNGTVGSGVVELLNKNREYVRRRTGSDIEIKKILVKDVNKHDKEKYKGIITDDIEAVYNTELDIVVEAIGGLHPAYDYIKSFLKKKKHVVTANKDVIAKYGEELSKLAEENAVSLRFEASVAGGIPILKPLQECLAGNDIQYIIAILNGTTNFILSKMYCEGARYEDALKIAQQLGFAEANPDSDVLGLDSARKLSILSSISYDERVEWERINIEGITEIDDLDILCAKEAGYTIKLLAISTREDDKIYAAVRPVLVPKDGRLGRIENEFNGIVLEGDAVGQMFFCGKGAGKLPTASAVMGDIFDVLENKKQKSMFITNKVAEIIPRWTRESKWMLKINCSSKKRILDFIEDVIREQNLFKIRDINDSYVSVILETDKEEAVEAVIASMKQLNEVYSVKKLMILDI